MDGRRSQELVTHRRNRLLTTSAIDLAIALFCQRDQLQNLAFRQLEEYAKTKSHSHQALLHELSACGPEFLPALRVPHNHLEMAD